MSYKSGCPHSRSASSRSTATTTSGWPSPTRWRGSRSGPAQVEVAVNGIGERAGNASLEEVVMALATRSDFYGAAVGVETRQLANTSRMVSNITGYEVPPNKAIVGRNAFLHESGIHQDGVLKDRGRSRS